MLRTAPLRARRSPDRRSIAPDPAAPRIAVPGEVARARMGARWMGARWVGACVLGLALAGCGPAGAKDYNQGIEHFRAAQYADAAAALERAIAENADFAEAHHSLGVCQIQLEQLDQAAASLDRARVLFDAGTVTDTEDNKTVAQKLALVHRHLGLIEEHRYQRQMLSDGDAAIAHLKLAKAQYEKTRSLDPDEPHAKQRIEQIEAFLARLDR